MKEDVFFVIVKLKLLNKVTTNYGVEKSYMESKG